MAFRECCGPLGASDDGVLHAMPQCAEAERRLLAALPEAAVSQDTSIDGPDGYQTWLHSVELPAPEAKPDAVPVVFLPGYGTGAAIFVAAWRQLLAEGGPSWQGDSRPQLFAVDPLGWFLSGRPAWVDGTDVTAAEGWFADSLEAWCKMKGIEVMDLVGHSIGGNIAATYAERYPRRVRTLVLVSPAGMPGEPADFQQKLQAAPWKPYLMLTLWGRGWTPAMALKCLPWRYGHRIATYNAARWSRGLPEGTLEQEALADYIYHGWSEGSESGEHALYSLLAPGAWGRRPLGERLPLLKVAHVELIYGDRDWVDVRHGNAAAEACLSRGAEAPATFVRLLEGAGHYGHLENISGFCRALSAALARPPDAGDARCAVVPEGFGDRYCGENVPMWRQWENYEFGR